MRRALPWVVAGWVAVQLAVRVAGRVLARRRNAGDEGSSTIRRVVVQGNLVLTPTSPDLSRIELDLLLAGAQVDLSALPYTTFGGIDISVRAAMGGLNVTVPAGWKVWWDSSGVGAIGPDRKRAPTRADSAHDADLRVHGTFLFAGAGITAAVPA